MKVILSYPYSGSLYWWFQKDRNHPLPKKPQHSYYAGLFGDVDKHLDVALTCALIYEEFVIPAADAVYPGFGDLSKFAAADLGLEVSEWDPIEAAQQMVGPVEGTWHEDPVLSALLRNRSDPRMELLYAAVDVLLAREHRIPVLCSDDRRATVRRLLELGVVPSDPEIEAQFNSPGSLGQIVQAYSQVTALTFGADGLREFLALKEMSPLREYAQNFQRAMTRTEAQTVDDFFLAIAEAMESQALATRVKGTFEGTGQVLSVLGLLPGIGTAAGLAGIGTTAGTAAAAERAEEVSWFELSSVVAGARSRRALETDLKARGMLP